jgi:hypothetical protein
MTWRHEGHRTRHQPRRVANVAVVDDHPFFRDGLSRGLRQSGYLEVVGDIGSASTCRIAQAWTPGTPVPPGGDDCADPGVELSPGDMAKLRVADGGIGIAGVDLDARLSAGQLGVASRRIRLEAAGGRIISTGSLGRRACRGAQARLSRS